MSHHLFDSPETLVDRPYSRRAGRVLGAPVAPSDVPRACADAEADECPRGPQPMKLADKIAVLFALAISAAMVLWSVETLVR